MKSLLVLGRGDTSYSDRSRRRLVDLAKKAGFDVKEADYHELNAVPDFKTEPIDVMLFFPFAFWNANCEIPGDTQLYGTSRRAYALFKRYFLGVRLQLEQRFGNRLRYVIPPQNAPTDRDKVETIRILKGEGIPTSEQVPYASLQDILNAISAERGVFIKCRYGAEGKGITVLHHERWVTNYRVEGDSLANYGTYEPWYFTDITGNCGLLHQLLQHDVIVEKEIVVPKVFDDKKFDLRVYVVGESVPHFFVRTNASIKEVTNYSQGATVLHHPYTELPESCLRLAGQIAIRTARAMGLKFAGVDIMFDGVLDNPRVVETQAFADFPDIARFNLARYMVSNLSGLFV